MAWVRLYTEIRHDGKIRRESLATRWLWVALLTLAKESPKPGWVLYADGVPVTAEDLADEANIGAEEVTVGLGVFTTKGMVEKIDGVYHLKNWDKRNFASDDVTPRVQKHRAKKQSNPHETLQKRYKRTQRNVTETPPEYRVQSTDTETEKDKSVTPAHREPSEVQQVIDRYHSLFVDTFGEKPNIEGGKDGATVKRLLGKYGKNKLLELLGGFFVSQDAFIQGSGYTIGVFASCLNKLIAARSASARASPPDPNAEAFAIARARRKAKEEAAASDVGSG